MPVRRRRILDSKMVCPCHVLVCLKEHPNGNAIMCAYEKRRIAYGECSFVRVDVRDSYRIVAAVADAEGETVL